MSDGTPPMERLRRKLDEAMAEPWDNMGELRAELSCDAPAGADSASGNLTFHARKRNGDWVIAHRQDFDELRDAQAVDDFLAEAFSILLAKHPAWLR